MPFSPVPAASSRARSLGARLSLRFKLGLVLFALGATLIGSAATSLYFSSRERGELIDANAQMLTLSQNLSPLRDTTRNLQVDVIQVQQFLSDASATHHDDSFEDAAKYAADYVTQSRTLNDLLGRLPQDAEVLAAREKLKDLDARFQIFDRKGVEMAHIYIARGVEAGNVEMESFDKMSDDLFKELDDFLKLIATRVDRATAQARDAVNLAQVSSEEMSRWVAALAALGLAVTAAAAWIVHSGVSAPLSRLTQSLRALSDETDARPIPDRERNDEIGAMARALAAFRDNREQSRKLEREMAGQREATEAARLADLRAKEATSRIQGEAMQRLAAGLRALANGDLALTLRDGFAEEFVAVRDNFNTALGELSDLVEAVVAGVRAIDSSARELSSAADQLARRAEIQAGALGETSTSMADLSDGLAATAEASTKTKDAINAAKQEAGERAAVVQESVEAIGRIKDSSDQIGAIIGVIDEIAFQTNLLALNAGVEAARAGDSGKGFAVVASEVRGLAQRSAEAAKEIKTLISESSVQVERGFTLVKTTGETFERVRARIVDIDGGIAAIAERALEQSRALKQMNSAFTEIDSGTQQNASMAEEANAACSGLKQECARLMEMVGRFRLRESQDSRWAA